MDGGIETLEIEGYIVKEEGPGIWIVISPRGDLYYIWKNNEYICTCPYHNIYHRECKHIKMVKQYNSAVLHKKEE
jgi:hypothetical protein